MQHNAPVLSLKVKLELANLFISLQLTLSRKFGTSKAKFSLLIKVYCPLIWVRRIEEHQGHKSNLPLKHGASHSSSAWALLFGNGPNLRVQPLVTFGLPTTSTQQELILMHTPEEVVKKNNDCNFFFLRSFNIPRSVPLIRSFRIAKLTPRFTVESAMGHSHLLRYTH